MHCWTDAGCMVNIYTKTVTMLKEMVASLVISVKQKELVWVTWGMICVKFTWHNVLSI